MAILVSEERETHYPLFRQGQFYFYGASEGWVLIRDEV
jgi:hypothetical protein